MIKVYLKNKIFIKLSQLEKHQRDYIIQSYRFIYSEYSAFTKKYENKVLNLFELVTWRNNERWCGLNPNSDYFKKVMNELGLEYNLIDLRVAPEIDFPKINLIPRENQKVWLEQLKEFEYNALLKLGTGSGKTTISIYVASLLKTPTLFIASKTSYLENFKKEVFIFVDNPEENYLSLDSEWFQQENPEVKPFMSCSIQLLSKNLEHLEKLKDKIGFSILDEIHSSIFGVEYRKAIFSLNSKYKLYLSATPKIKSGEIVNCMVSSRVISDDTDIDFDIQYSPIVLDLGVSLTSKINKIENFSLKTQEVFNNELLKKSVSDLATFAVNKNRGVLVFSTNIDFQESISRLLSEQGISNIIFNSNTKKKLYEQYLKDLDSGVIKVLIGGTAVIEALSLYRLSLIIDTDLSLSENSIVQLIGRLKRRNPEICPKQKVYIKLIYKNISEKKFKHTTLPTLKTMSYIKILPTKSTNNYNLVELL